MFRRLRIGQPQRLDVARDQLGLYSPEYLDKLKELVAQAEKSCAERYLPPYLPRRQAHLLRHAR